MTSVTKGLDALTEKVLTPQVAAYLKWGTVVNPATPTITLDGETSEVIPKSWADDLRKDDRVLCAWQGTQLIVIKSRNAGQRLGDNTETVAEIVPVVEDLGERLSETETVASDAADNATAALQGLSEAIKSTVIQYAVNSSETVPPASDSPLWSTATPVRTPGTYVWMRSVVTRADDSTAATPPALVTGNDGAQGPQGEDGTSVTIEGNVPSVSQLPTGLGSTDAGKGWITDDDGHLHVWSGTAWTDVGEIRGPEGPQGSPGQDGRSITSVDVWYYLSTSATALVGGTWVTNPPDWVNGRYMWSKTITSFSSGSPEETPAVNLTGAAGSTGTPGSDGRGIVSFTEQYYLSTSPTALTGGSWQGTPPAWVNGRYYWTQTVITYTSGSPDTTTPIMVSGGQGPQGIPGSPGTDGTDGQSLYTWLKYADTPTSGMSDSPVGKTYMGIAYNKTTADESSNYSDYQWSLIQGPEGDQGIPGTPGDDGQSLYTWIRYADDASGNGMADLPGTKPYIGFAFNKTTPAESSTPTDYQWSKILGPSGADAGIVSLTATTQVLTSPPAGGATNPATAVVTGTAVNTTISSWTYSINGSATFNAIPTTAGWITRSGNVVTITGATMTARTVTVRMANSSGVADTLTVAKVFDGAQGTAGTPGADGADGAAGRGVADVTVTYQSTTSNTVPTGGTWSSTPPTAEPGKYVWTRVVTTYTDGLNPTTNYSVGRVGSDGDPGDDGKGITGTAAVTYVLSASGITPPTSGWVASPIPVPTTALPFLWTRSITTYTDASTSVSYSVARKGDDGAAGADAYTVLLTNENHTFPGTATAAIPAAFTSTILAYKGATSLPVTGVSITGQVAGLTATASGSTITVTALSTPALTATGGKLVVTFTADGRQFTKDLSWSVARAGAQGSQGIPGNPGADGQSLYTWLKYADTPTTGMSDSPVGKTYMGLALNKTTATESSTYSDYTWSLIKGADGVQGTPGADGVTTYTWVKYADTVTGTGMADDPAGKKYIGLAFNKTTATESSTATDYQWALIQGPQGTPGADGAPAKMVSLTATTQVLSAPPTPTNAATTPTTAVVTGTATNTTITVWQYAVDTAPTTWVTIPTTAGWITRSGNVVTVTGSSMTARTVTVRMADASGVADTLTVAKVRDGAKGDTGSTGGTGAPGAAGADAITPILSNESHVFPGSTTAALAGSTTTTIIAYKGATRVPITVDSITGAVTGISAVVTSGSGTNTVLITVTATTSLVALSGKFQINMTIDGKALTREFSWSVSRAGATGGQGPQGVSVTGVVSYYRLLPTGSGQPATPSGETPAGWSTTEPSYAPGQELWRSERVNFSSGTPGYSYTVPQKSSAYAAAVYVGNLAEEATQGLVKVSVNDPGHYPGRIWWQLNSSGNGIGIKVSVNNAWAPYQLVADQLLIPSSIGATLIADNAITTGKIKSDAFEGQTFTGGTFSGATFNGGRFQTSDLAERGIKIDGPTNQLILYSNTGDVLFHLSPTGGVSADSGYIGASYGIVGSGSMHGVGGGIRIRADGPWYGYGGGGELTVDSFGRLTFQAFPWSETSTPAPGPLLRLDTLPDRMDAVELAMPQYQAGSSTMNISASSTPGALVGRITVAFPKAFTGSSVPRVMAVQRGTAGALDNFKLHMESVSNTSFTVRATVSGSSTIVINSVPIDWIAIK